MKNLEKLIEIFYHNWHSNFFIGNSYSIESISSWMVESKE